MQDEVLRMEQITKVYGNGVVANKDVDFNLRRGEIHALMGENGAGKSTLMNILFGLEQPSRGQIILNGKEVKLDNSAKALALGIGMVHQHFMLVPSLTVAENLILGNEPTRGILTDMKYACKKVDELAKQYNFSLNPRTRIKDLTVGQKQQVEILKALYRGAQILILDEPTAVLAPQETEQLFKQLKILKDNGHTLVFISHKIREVIEICDRVTIMRAGQNKGIYNIRGNESDGSRDISEEDISRLMVGRDMVLDVNKAPAHPKEVILKVENLLNVDFENKIHVNYMNFTVRKGEILGIAGVEGNGQSELIEMITKLRNIDSGNVSVNGEDIGGMGIKEVRERLMAYIPQDRLMYGVAPAADIKDNLIPFLVDKKDYLKGLFLDDKKLAGLADQVIEEFSVKCDSSQQFISMLSGGNMQKVVVARELSGKIKKIPPLVIADQPSRGIDIGATKFIHRKLVELRDQGAAVLLVSADLNEILELSDSVLVMYDGKISGYFPDASKLTEKELGQYMLGLKIQTKEEIGGAFHGQKKR